MDTQSTIAVEKLPAWMLHAQRGTDWGMIGVMLFALLISWQFWTGTDLNLLNANRNHAFMIADVAQSIREGEPYPRWSAYALEGYGAPIPHYYPIGAAYTAAVIEVFFTNDPVTALRITYTLVFLIAACAMYAFVSRWMGTKSGLIASLLYLSTPYFSLTAPYILGDFSAVMSYALFAALMWAVSRRMSQRTHLDFVLVSLLSAALILTDIRVILPAVLTIPILLFWNRYFQRRRSLLQVTVPIFVGFMLAAFFIVPAIFERDAIRWTRQAAYYPRLPFVYDDLTAPLYVVDPLVQNPIPQLSLGTGFWMLIIVGSLASLIYRKRTTLPLMMIGLFIILIRIFLILFSEQNWFIGVIIFCGAVVGGATIYLENLLPRPMRKWFLAFLIGFILISWLPALTRPVERAQALEFTPEAQLQYEQEGFGTAVLPPGWEVPNPFVGDFLPLQMNLPSREVNDSKVSIDQLYRDVQITTLFTMNHGTRFQIDSPQPISLIYQTAAFPGWQATVNDTMLQTTQNPQTGLLQIEMPAVRNGILDVYFGSTQIHTIGWILSGLSLLFLLWMLRRGLQTERHIPATDSQEETTSLPLIDRIPEDDIYRTIPVIAVFLGFIFIVVGTNSPLLPRQGYQLEDAAQIMRPINEIDGLQLLAYKLNKDQREFNAGELIDLAFYWNIERPLDTNILVSLGLQDTQDERIVFTQAPRFVGGVPSKQWSTLGYVLDHYRFYLPSTLPAGEYQILLTLFTCEARCDRISQPAATIPITDFLIVTGG